VDASWYICRPTLRTTTSIEEAFAKIKNLLRKAAARSKEALIEAIAAALFSAITAEDIRGYFQHAGYPLAGQLL